MEVLIIIAIFIPFVGSGFIAYQYFQIKEKSEKQEKNIEKKEEEISKLKEKIEEKEENIREFKSKIRDLNSIVKNLEIENTRFQLNPHLFKNTLNGIQNFALKSYRSIESLNQILGYIIGHSRDQQVTLEDEIEFSKGLMKLYEHRVHPGFKVHPIDDQTHNENGVKKRKMLPSLITASFIENAFKHSNLDDPDGFVRVGFYYISEQIVFRVENSIAGEPEIIERKGLGKENLKKHLDLFFGKDAEVKYSIDGRRHIAELSINIQIHERKDHMHHH